MIDKEDALRLFMPEGVAKAADEEVKTAVSRIKEAGFQDSTKERVCAEDIFSFWVAENNEKRNLPC